MKLETRIVYTRQENREFIVKAFKAGFRKI